MAVDMGEENGSASIRPTPTDVNMDLSRPTFKPHFRLFATPPVAVLLISSKYDSSNRVDPYRPEMCRLLVTTLSPPSCNPIGKSYRYLKVGIGIGWCGDDSDSKLTEFEFYNFLMS